MLETGTRIAVALTTDDNNILPMSVTIASLLEAAAENTSCDIYIFMQNQPQPQIAERIMSFERLYPRCAIHPRTVDPDALSCAVVSVKHLGLANFYRLLLPTLLPEHDRVIYLDTDTLVMS
ncbi:MAG: hypothetical protein LBB86_02220, partial [Oscillospiraceae bacterium]|nr:hypothetical protein [Oscillospiraceae bacterium]